MKRVRFFLFTLLLIVSASAVLFARGDQESPQTGFTEGRLDFIDGVVTVDGAEVSIGDVVPDGAIVQTGPVSYCDIVFGEQNVIRLYENTLATISFSRGSLDMKSGAMGAVLNRLSAVVAGTGNKFQVESPQVVGGVRGTSFFLKIEDEKSTYLCACQGKLNLNERVGLKNNLESDHHIAYHFITDGDTVRAVQGEMLYHSDESMEAIADRIDYTIPWVK